MTLNTSRAGAPDRHRPTAENPGEKFRFEVTHSRRRTPVWHAHAGVQTVVGRMGNPRLVLRVPRYRSSRQPHGHLAGLPFLATVRKRACGACYNLRAVEVEVAA